MATGGLRRPESLASQGSPPRPLLVARSPGPSLWRIVRRETELVSIGTYLRVGSELLGYRIERVLGRGGMGVVYLAHQLALQRLVALKLLAPELAADERFRERFLDESKLAASLDHPSIVPVIDAGEVDGRLYIAMRYVEGTDLKRLLEVDAPLEPKRALALLTPVADALDAAHSKGLVHRDVKPSNVLLDQEEHVYLADFGLAKPVSERGLVEQSHFTASVEYVSPEQVVGEPVGPTADVYSLGCVLYECLTGQVPFRADSLIAVLWGHVNESPPLASERNPDLPSAIDAIFTKALAKSPDERYPNCDELISSTREALGIDDVVGVRDRRPVALLGVGLLVAVAAAAAALLLSRGGGGSQPITQADSLVRIDPGTSGVIKRIPVGHGARGVAVGAGAVWVSAEGDSSLWRVDPRTGVTQRVTGLADPTDVAVAGSGFGASVYVGYSLGVAQIVPSSGVALGRVNGTAAGEWANPSVSAGKLGVWIGDSSAPAVDRLGLSQKLGATGVVEGIPIARGPDETTGFNILSAIAVGESAVWATGDTLEHVLFRIEPSKRTVNRFALPSAPGPVAVGAGAVWVGGQLEDVVWRVDPRSGTVTNTIPVGRGVSAVAVGDGSIWVTSSIDGTVSRIDPRTRKVVETIPVGGVPEDVAVGADGVWVLTRAS